MGSLPGGLWFMLSERSREHRDRLAMAIQHHNEQEL